MGGPLWGAVTAPTTPYYSVRDFPASLSPPHSVRLWVCVRGRLCRPPSMFYRVFWFCFLFPWCITMYLSLFYLLFFLCYVHISPLLQLFPLLPSHFVCISFSLNYLWLSWTCYSSCSFLSNFIFLWPSFEPTWPLFLPSVYQLPFLFFFDVTSYPSLSPWVLMSTHTQALLLWLLQPGLGNLYFCLQGRWGSRQQREATSAESHNPGLCRSVLWCPKFCTQTWLSGAPAIIS